MLSKPECCSSEDMDCSACLRNTAQNVARLCGEMDRGGLRGVFGQLYTHPYCKAQIHLFERAYTRVAESVLAVSAA